MPSELFKSNLTMPEPFRSCNKMEAVTIGPIPNEIREPNSAPSMSDKNWNCASELAPNPNKGTRPRIKKSKRTTTVHLSFSLKGNRFSVGPITSGRLRSMLFIPIRVPLFWKNDFSFSSFN